jgi:hypothetical protein
MTPESALSRAVTAWLDAQGIRWCRNNSGAVGGERFIAYGLRYRVRGKYFAGGPDYLVFLPPAGRCVGIELKARRNGLSESQRAWAKHFASVGVAVYLCRSVADVRAAIAGERAT